MQTPKRKIGRYAQLKPDPNLTEKKYDELKEKLVRLKKTQPLAAAEVRRLAEMGDFSDNAAYSIAKGRLRGINQRILELGDQLRRAIIIKPAKITGNVQLGSIVTIENNGEEKTYRILGSAETDPAKGIISHHSPLGRSLLGRRVGDKIRLKTANKEMEYKIIRLE